MWSEDFDNKIKLAADSAEPPFDEKSWSKMSTLLDEHLPREKKRRRLLFLLFLFLLTGSTVFLLLQRKPSPQTATTEQITPTPLSIEKGNPSSSTQSEPEKTATGKTSDSKPAGIIQSPATSIKTNEPVSATRAGTGKQKENRELSTSSSNTPAILNAPGKLNNSSVAKNQTTRKATGFVPGSRTLVVNATSKKNINNVKGNNVDQQKPVAAPVGETATVTRSDGENKSVENSSSATSNPPAIVAEVPVASGSVAIDKAPADTVAKEELAVAEPVQAENAAKKQTKKNRFSILISAGPDLSGISLDQPGKWKMQYGVGVSYAINEKWQLRTGFFASRKIYSADSADYHPPKGYWDYYSSVGKISANCLVYEIPLNVIYNFSSGKHHQWFASAGISSYLMKSETYTYNYESIFGQPGYARRTYDNNKHLFSIVQLSGGYRHQFTDRFSLMIEPYVKLPLAGVGYGKVKLNSGGILFSAALQPFRLKK